MREGADVPGAVLGTAATMLAVYTIVKTADNVLFATVEDKTLPKSAIVIFPPSVTFGTADLAIEAVNAGPSGNVLAHRAGSQDDHIEFAVGPKAPARLVCRCIHRLDSLLNYGLFKICATNWPPRHRG